MCNAASTRAATPRNLNAPNPPLPVIPGEDRHSSGQTRFYLWFLTRNRSECETRRDPQRPADTLESSAPTLVPPTVHESAIAPQNVRRLDPTFPVGAFKIKAFKIKAFKVKASIRRRCHVERSPWLQLCLGIKEMWGHVTIIKLFFFFKKSLDLKQMSIAAYFR